MYYICYVLYMYAHMYFIRTSMYYIMCMDVLHHVYMYMRLCCIILHHTIV